MPADEHTPRGSQERWRRERRYLNGHRYELTESAKLLYRECEQVGPTGLLVGRDWLATEPVPLERIRLEWAAEVPAKGVDGSEPESSPVRPLRGDGQRYAWYADALGALDPPRLFENRASYRLLGIQRGEDGRLVLGFGKGSYFDVVNVCEAVGHEFAVAYDGNAHGRPSLERLPFRRLIGDPCDPARRPLMIGISVLTLRRDRTGGAAGFVLHRRDAKNVAHGGGLYHVMPVGTFQPSADAAWNERHDLDLWRSIAREYHEEFLGGAEHYGSDHAPIDYDGWPFFRTLSDAREIGAVRASWLGLGVDPLTLVTDLLIAVVFDDDVYDALFGQLAEANLEGEIVNGDAATGIPFSEESVKRFVYAEPTQAAGAALLWLAWRHKAALLER